MDSERRIAILTLGCAKNEVDSETMNTRLRAAGYVVVDDPAHADAVIVNTCSFIQAAVEESLETIFDLADEAVPGRRIIVAGCMPSRYGDELAAELHEADGFVPCSKEDDIVEVVNGLFEQSDVTETDVSAGQEPIPSCNAGQVSRYVKISDGCNRFCSFCTIPYIRGRYHSFPYADIEADVQAAVDEGAGEIVLIAQDTGIWGRDFDEPKALDWLLANLAETFPETWFRVMYIQPDGVTDELIATVAAHGNLCNYFDIPVQHCNADVLAAMHRKGDSASLLSLLGRIRAAIPDVSLRTTIMVGFPGETDDMFEELLAFLEEAEFDYAGVFAYSQEDGTRASELPNQVDSMTKLERMQAVRDLCDGISAARIAANVGKRVDVLIEGVDEDGHPFGRTQGQAPEVDGYTFVEDAEPGEVVSVIIEDTVFYDMEGMRA